MVRILLQAHVGNILVHQLSVLIKDFQHIGFPEDHEGHLCSTDQLNPVDICMGIAKGMVQPGQTRNLLIGGKQSSFLWLNPASIFHEDIVHPILPGRHGQGIGFLGEIAVKAGADSQDVIRHEHQTDFNCIRHNREA